VSVTADSANVTDLSAFQRDLLWALSHDDARKGLSLKAELADYYGEDLNHSRLYQNLDKLVDRGLVAKQARDKRTNEYRLTESARRALEARSAWQAGGSE
jgi:DNA-binding PadR family transcriptional regulator